MWWSDGYASCRSDREGVAGVAGSLPRTFHILRKQTCSTKVQHSDVCLTKILEHNSFNPGWDAHKKHCAWKDPSLYSSFIIALLPEDKYIQLKKHFRELYWLDFWEFHWKNDTFNRATSFLFKMLFMVFFSCNASQNLSLYGCSVCITLERPDRQFEPFSFLFSCYFGCAKWI